MGKPIFCAYASRKGPEDSAQVFLALPATPYEMLDMRDKLQLGENDAVKVRIDEYYRFAFLSTFLCGQKDLPQLNALAQRLSALDDQQAAALEGLLVIRLQTGGTSIRLPDLINMAYNTQNCRMIGEALNDSQLGRFCAENGLVPEVDKLSKQIIELLDFERIGREHRQKAGGLFVERTTDHLGGYVEFSGKIANVYEGLDLTLKMPDYTILLQVSKGFFNDPDHDSDKTALLKLPASLVELDAVLDGLDVWDWREAGWTCIDCRVPALADAVSDADAIEFLNHWAQRLSDMSSKDLSAYKRLLETASCQDLSIAEQLIDTMKQDQQQDTQRGGMTLV